MINKSENVRKVVYDEWVILSCWLATWLLSWGYDSVWDKVQEILIFENSALYLNIMLEVHQVPFGYHLGPIIIHIGEDFVQIPYSGFWFKI